MLDIGWTELLFIGIVALIVVGPKDLPVMFRTLGRFTGQARKMAREFTRAMDEAADEAGVKDVQRDLKAMTNPKSMGMDALKDATDFGDWSDADLDAAAEAKQKPKPKPSDSAGPATRKLAEERAEKAAKLQESVAAKAAKTGTDDTAA
ncbi:MAG: Sec-independent protein translocase protein TatB [Pseudomonadota bacterium]